MNGSLIPVILAGGKGERFWPLSRRHRPKQFLSLDGSGKSLLQATADRLLPLAGNWENLWVVTSSQLAEGVAAQLPQMPAHNILAEPEGRDTAPAVAWSTLEIAQRYGEDAVIGFFPADPWIGDLPGFQHTLQAAAQLAATTDAIATLGVKPSYPATGYGYIEQGDRTGIYGNLPVYRVNRFTEKPDLHTAEEFLSTGRFCWNSGMFIFRAGVVLKELHTHAPDILIPLKQQGRAAYSQLPKISIDYALMEKTKLAYVLPADFGWDDLGDWNAIARLLQGETPNVEVGHHVGLDTAGSLVYAENDEDVVVTIGLEDVVIVRDRNVTLIVKKDRTQEIKQVLKLLQDNPKFSHLL
ncbi:MAG: Alginate biosynthesis protein AlgA [Chroococcidiopsis cubana SAG 39.79]|uniref:Mannose-1-phosphate guanylyltransferase n=1 Tax=Chroococcidiopsis cubana SAG 39.79 TaxID=388085 RepID=A0AB37UM30_9CYAN|nr:MULTISPECIES: mannose-1-phosphate guanylyltransferase [Chroococcidiopsis]PSB43558.1 mannose-1-phosphate guanylyltransferase [Cyanosarcina cf. burmensis CCALA 770]MDZ4875957.1 Alginate biosynthesis protein AlgA [Chroococcidiopsis cubana SAG 39.79]PSB64671.1 mannose-1-phosphate guanylyltransferase [Chroococcidiopsis cubana CCALA 043]RUT12426.1 mannose-1-phosphate guanylyltransferase [Chroococcidiopsis cubana SAG 39.79]URD49240.1 mannose-1-phosphate guanylyltransferase [Chroococcidiopsis sp. C